MHHMKPDREQLIIEAAVSSFSQIGFASCKIADVAAHAGVGKGTVYEYFRSKEELLIAACIASCETNALRIADNLEQAKPANPVAIAYHQIRAVLEVLLKPNQPEQRLFGDLLMVCRDQPELFSQAQQRLGSKLSEWIALVQGIHETGIEHGVFKPELNSPWASRLIVAMVDGLIWQGVWMPMEHPMQSASDIATAWMRLIMTEPHRLEEYLA